MFEGVELPNDHTAPHFSASSNASTVPPSQEPQALRGAGGSPRLFAGDDRRRRTSAGELLPRPSSVAAVLRPGAVEGRIPGEEVTEETTAGSRGHVRWVHGDSLRVGQVESVVGEAAEELGGRAATK